MSKTLEKLVNWEIYQEAVAKGCDPQWADGIIGWAWHCTCDDNKHGMDQQCSAISIPRLEKLPWVH